MSRDYIDSIAVKRDVDVACVISDYYSRYGLIRLWKGGIVLQVLIDESAHHPLAGGIQVYVIS
jgi:hypothetical protein